MTSSEKPIVWTTPHHPIDRREIARVEEAWCIRFPKEYIEIALTGHGGHPSADVLEVEGWGRRLFGELDNFVPESQSHIVHAWAAYFNRLPSRVFPFADDGGGNPFAFDYRKGPENPAIFYFHHEFSDDNGIMIENWVADSFAEFLNTLKHDPLMDDEEFEEDEEIE